MSRIVRFHQHGGPEVLVVEDIDVPSPAPGEVQIRVKAIGINRADALLRSGTYIETATLPAGLGLEAAGTVTAVGDGVRTFSPGDAVSVIPPISMVPHPTYGEIINMPARNVVRHPATMGWDAAAAVWMQFLTAYGALIPVARVQAGDIVAVTAASSSVGLAAIQIANLQGATPIAVTRTSAKRQALLDNGAVHVVASQEEDVEARLKEIAGRQGVRVVFDAVGGPIFNQLTAAMSHRGILIEYGGLSQEPTPFPLAEVLSKCLTLRGFLVHEVTGDAERLAEALSYIRSGLSSGRFKPVLARTFPLEDIVEAHRYLEAGTQFGKVIVTV